MTNNLFNKLILSIAISAIVILANGDVFANEPATPPAEEKQSSEEEHQVNINQIAFIVKFDQDGNGMVDDKEFTGGHFPSMDKNSDGFIEPHEAPEGETAY